MEMSPQTPSSSENTGKKCCLDRDVRNHFRLRLAEARAAALADGEAAEQVIFAIEAFTRYLVQKDVPLGTARKDFLRKVKECLDKECLDKERLEDFDKKLQLLLFGRNQRMHRGFAARDLTRDAVRVVMILEDALRVEWSKFKAQDVMTPNPVTASTWHTFGMLRDAMVENAFSIIPICLDGRWRTISEQRVAMLMQEARAHKPKELDLRSVRLDERPCSTEKWGILIRELRPHCVPIVSMDEPVAGLRFDGGCVLVVRKESDRQDDPGELVGIITPADVM